MTRSSAKNHESIGAQATKLRFEEAELGRTRHERLVSRRELDAAVEATIYGWGGTVRRGEWDARRLRVVPDAPMGTRICASLKEPSTESHQPAKSRHYLERPR